MINSLLLADQLSQLPKKIIALVFVVIPSEVTALGPRPIQWFKALRSFIEGRGFDPNCPTM